MQRLYDFVVEHVPNVILVAPTGQYAEVLFSYVSLLSDSVLAEEAKLLAGSSDTGHIDIKWADQAIAQVWENSAAAKEELTDQPVLVRRAVAIGRAAIYGQIPVLCSLAGTNCAFIACDHILGSDFVHLMLLHTSRPHQHPVECVRSLGLAAEPVHLCCSQ